MSKKEKGFTLTEVLATLVILGILIAIAIPSVSKLQEKFKKDYYKELEGTVLASAKTYFKDNVYKTIIPRNVKLSEAPSYGMPISVYAPKSKGARCYEKLANELLKSNKQKGGL